MTVVPANWSWYFKEEQEVRDQWWHPAAGDVVIDVGSMMGNYTVPALANGASCIAIDPNTRDTDLLRQVAEHNGFSDRLTILNLALYDGGAYTAEMTQGLRSSPYAHLMPPPGCPFMTLDEVAEQYSPDGRVDWVKIDVEGAELGVLHGGVKTLEKWHPSILIEDHTLVYEFVREMDSTNKIKQLLGDLGYTVEQHPFDALRTFLVATA